MSNQLPRPPVPEFLDRVNFITAFFYQGCDLPFNLFVQCAREPLGELVGLFIGLDIQDITKEFFRPKGLRTARHGRKGRRGKKRGVSMPDPNEEIARRLPFGDEVRGRKFGSPTFYAFAVHDIYEGVAIRLAIVDKISETLYAGCLGVLTLNQDNCGWMARSQRHNFTGPLLGAGDWQAHQNFNLDYEQGLVSSNSFGFAPGKPGMWLCCYEAYWENEWIMPRQAKIGLVDWAGKGVICESPLATVDPGGSVTLTASGVVADPTGIGFGHIGFDSAGGPVRRTAMVICLTK